MSWHYNNKRQQKQVHKENTTNIFAKTQSNTCLVALPFKILRRLHLNQNPKWLRHYNDYFENSIFHIVHKLFTNFCVMERRHLRRQLGQLHI